MTLQNATLATTLAVTDLKRAKEFYGRILGLKEVGALMPEKRDGEFVYQIGNNNFLCLYARPEPSGSTATACSFEVADVEATVKALKDKGVAFEDYDMPEMGLKTKKGIATMGAHKAAWFKDPDGNILSIGNAVTLLKGNVKGAAMTHHA